MAWWMSVDYSVRSPKFDFVLLQGVSPFRDEKKSGLCRAMRRGFRFEGTVHPNLAARQKDRKKLCDAFNLWGYICVSSKFRDIIEDLEPNAHQFFPITLEAKDGSRHNEQPYFIFNPCAVVDALLGKAGLPQQWGEVNIIKLPYTGGHSLDDVVSMVEVGNRHIWVGDFLGRNEIYISDALHKKFQKAKVRYLWCRPVIESDAIWRPEEQMPRVMRWLEADPERIHELIEVRPDWVRRHRPDWLN